MKFNRKYVFLKKSLIEFANDINFDQMFTQKLFREFKSDPE